MARYRKIDPRIWKDENFCRLSAEEKLIAIYSFTAQSNRVGIFSFSPGEAAEDLSDKDTYAKRTRYVSDTFAKGFRHVLDTLNWRWDSAVRVLYIPTWWKYNQPENPKHLLGCLNDLEDLPYTLLLNEFWANTKYLAANLLDTFRIRIPIPMPIRMPYQELELELELKQEQEHIHVCGEFENVKLSEEDQGKLIEQFGHDGALQRIEALSAYMASKGKTYRNHYATIVNWENRNGVNGNGRKERPDITAENIRRSLRKMRVDDSDSDERGASGGDDQRLLANPHQEKNQR